MSRWDRYVSKVSPKLWPLRGEARAAVEEWVAEFAKEVASMAEEIFLDVAYELPLLAEGKAWDSFRDNLLAVFVGEWRERPQEWEKLRDQLFSTYKDEILAEISQQIVEENSKLKEEVEVLRQRVRELEGELESRFTPEQVDQMFRRSLIILGKGGEAS